MIALWVLGGFLAGAAPFAVWLGRWVAARDVRAFGDGNPGAVNAWRAGGWRLGALVLLLDFLKGALPVSLARLGAGYQGWPLAAVALAPVAGHAYSPFLGGRGGKALAVTFGVWAGLTLAEGPLVLGGLMTLAFGLQRADSWSVVFALAGLLAYLLVRGAEPWLLGVWAGNTLVLVLKQRTALRQAPRLRWSRQGRGLGRAERNSG